MELSSLLLISYQQNIHCLQECPQTSLSPSLLQTNSGPLALLLSVLMIWFSSWKKENLRTTDLDWNKDSSTHLLEGNIWFIKRGAREGDSLVFLVCLFQDGSPNQWVILHKRNQGITFLYLSELKQSFHHMVWALKEGGLGRKGASNFLLGFTWNLTPLKLRWVKRGINGHLLPGLILRSLLSVEEERSPLFLTTYLAEMSLLPLWGGLRKGHFEALVTQI